MDVDEELQQLIAIRDYANKRIRELRSLINMVKPKMPTDEIPDGSYKWVRVSDISKYVNDWDGTWTQLALDSGTSTKTISNIRDGLAKWVREDTADRIMMALGLPHISIELHDKRPEIPNPPPSHYYEE